MILAGGKSRRMNFNDKSLQKINKYSLIDRVIVRAKKQVDYLLINSNSDHIKNNYNEYIVIKDTTNIIKNFPIIGEERLILKLQTPQSSPKPETTIDYTLSPLIIYKINSVDFCDLLQSVFNILKI